MNITETVREKSVLPYTEVPALSLQGNPGAVGTVPRELPVFLQECKQTNKDKYTRVMFLSYTSLGHLNCGEFLLKRSPTGSRLVSVPWRPAWHQDMASCSERKLSPLAKQVANKDGL